MSRFITEENFQIDGSLRKELRDEIRSASSLTWDWKRRAKVWLGLGPDATNRFLVFTLLATAIMTVMAVIVVCSGIVMIDENIGRWMRSVSRFRANVASVSPAHVSVVRGSLICLLSFVCFFGPRLPLVLSSQR